MLSKRLLEVSRYVKNGSVVADIGCDHALLSIFLIENHIARHVIASDINEGPINNAKSNIARSNLVDSIETRLGSGLKTIGKNEVDVCVISGMGGTLISTILDESYNVFSSIEHIITQANNSNYQLRQYMTANGYYVEDESLVEDNDIIYTVIHFQKGNKNYSELELKYGPIILKRKDSLFMRYISELIESKQKILNQIPIENKEKQQQFSLELDQLKSLLK